MTPARLTAASTRRPTRAHAPSRKMPQLRWVADRPGRVRPAPDGAGWSRLDPFAGAELAWVTCRERLAGRSADAQSVLATVGRPAGTTARPGTRPSAARSAPANSPQDPYRFSGTLARARTRPRSTA